MANLIKNLFQSLQPKPSITIGVSLNQSGLLELCTLDKGTNCIKKYANRTIKYNVQNREIESIEEFKANILSMYEELSIPNNCNVVLSMPNVFFELISVPLILDTYATEGVLLGEVEQSYIFKKNTPKISWVELGQNARSDNKLLAYSAIQQSVAETLIKAFADIGSKLIAIDNSYYNLINTISHTQIAKHEIETQAPWDIVMVTNNSFVICSMSGDKLVEFYEEPLALRSISDENEIYSSLTASINASIQNYVANSILVISDFENVDAAVLCDQISFHGKKNYLNQNKYSVGQVVETAPGILPDYISSITLYALGSAIYPYIEDGKRLNLVVEEENAHKSDTYVIGDDMVVTEEMVQAFTIIMAILILALAAVLWFFVTSTNKTYEAKIKDYQKRTEDIKRNIEEMQQADTGVVQKSFDLTTAKKDIQFKNQQTILYYNLLSFNIPQSTWITHFYSDAKGAVAIEGKTSSTNNVYLFFKGIKATIENSDLALTKLKYADGFEDEIAYTNKNIYEFTLSNSKRLTLK